MHKSDYCTAGAFVAVGMVFLVGSLQLGLSSPTSDGIPGSGFFPFILAALVVVLGVALIIKSILYKEEKKASFALTPEQRGNAFAWIATICGIAGMLIVWFVLSRVDSVRGYAFEIAVFLFAFAMNRFFKRSWAFTAVFSVAIVALIHILFVRVLFIAFEI